MMHVVKKYILLLLFLFSGFIFSQDQQLKEIDLLLTNADTYNKKYEDINEFTAARKANILAKKIHDEERTFKSYYFIARSLYNLGLHKQSLSCVDKVSSEEYLRKNIILNALFTELKANIYASMNLKSQSKAEFSRVIKLLKDEHVPDATEIKARVYANFAVKKFNPDSTFVYFRLQEQELKKLPEKKYHDAICEHYYFVGDQYLSEKKTDSAFYYFEKSYRLKQKYQDPVLYIQYSGFGSYYAYHKENIKALDYYLKAVQNMKMYSSNSADYSNLYKLISNTYAQLGDQKKKKEYDDLAIQTENKVLTEQNKNMASALNIFLKDKKQEFDESKRRQFMWIALGIFILICIFLILYNILRKNLKDKENIITEVQTSLQEKEEIITQKGVETKELQQKVNDSYGEVIDLAKNNDPSFYFRFQEVYPDFQKKLLEHSPGLRTSELVLCAYTFLGFSIKDIAEYTFKSINTVRNRKQNLRKKFNIPTEVDMGIWLRKLVE